MIPDADMRQYADFGQEISRRFGTPVAEVAARALGATLTIPTGQAIDHIVTMEDIANQVRTWADSPILSNRY